MASNTGTPARRGLTKLEGKLPRTASTSDLGRVASPSIDSSTDPEDGGIRLDALSISDSPPLSRYTPPHTRLGLGSSTFARVVRDSKTTSPSFEVGDKPSGDVFLSPTKAFKERRAGRSVTSPLENDETAVQDTTASPTRPFRARFSSPAPRHQVGGVDAQGIYPPSACVFVANLPEPKDDRALEAAVTREFSKHGTVFVKIRRDTHHMPFAFCQYTKDEDAQTAMECGRGSMILGRACRTEMVKANRTFIVFKRRRGAVTVDEVRSLLEPFGSLNKCEYLHQQLREMLGLPMTVIVEFSMFDPARDLNATFRHHDEFRVDAFDLKKNGQGSRNDVDEAFLNQYEVDRRSVFVGGLPHDINETELKEILEDVGDVVSIQLIKKPTNLLPRVFAFVEFTRPDLPDLAIQKHHDTMLGDFRLRVERKIAREHTQTPRRPRVSSYYGMSPRDTAITGSPATPDARAMLSPFQQSGGSQPATSMPTTATPTWNWVYSGQPFAGNGYMATPSSPFGTQMGVSAIPMTPQATPGGMSPYPYYGGFWPGISYVQDPATGMGYYAYSSPTELPASRSAVDEPAPTPTRTVHLGTSHLPGAEHAINSEGM